MLRWSGRGNCIVGGVSALVVYLVAVESPLFGDDVQDLFDSIFGPKIKEVGRTRTRTDDVDLAQQMLKVAGDSSESPKLVILLCDQAYRLASKDPAGYGVAISSLRLLARHAPDRRWESIERVAILQQRLVAGRRGEEKKVAADALIDTLIQMAELRMEAGETDAAINHYRRALQTASAVRSDRRASIQAKLEQVRAEQRLAGRIASLRDRIKQKDKEAAKELLRLYVVELDRPLEARKYTFATDDETWKTNVTLATRDIWSLEEQEAMALGDWYRGLVDSAPAAARGPLLVRAHRYYRVFLTRHPQADLARTKAGLALKTVDAALEGLGIDPASVDRLVGKPPETSPSPAPVATSRELDALKLVDLEQDSIRGTWGRRGTALRSGMGLPASFVQLPVTPRGDYVVTAQFMRVQGEGSVNLVFPMGERQGQVVLGGWGNARSMLHLLDWQKSEAGSVGQSQTGLENGRVHRVELDVRAKGAGSYRIRVTLDGKKIIDWSGPSAAFTLLPTLGFPQRPVIGLGGGRCAVEYRQASLRMRSGKAVPLRGGAEVTGLQAGLVGAYFAGDRFQKKVAERVDQAIDFNWGGGRPHPDLPIDHFSVRWSGFLKVPADGEYTFHVAVDDLMKVWIGNVPGMTFTRTRTPSGDRRTSTRRLTAGTHPIRIEFHEGTIGAWARLDWSRAGEGGFERRVLGGEALWHRAPEAAKPTAAGATLDLRRMVDLDRDRVPGTKPWIRRWGQLVSPGEKFARINLSIVPVGDYELSVTFSRLSGTDSVNLILPVGDSRQVMFAVDGWVDRGTRSGLSMLGGKWAPDTPTSIDGTHIQPGKWHRLQARVIHRGEDIQIEVDLDGRLFLKWSGARSQISLSPLWKLSRTDIPGLGAYTNRTAFRDVALRMLSGRVKLVRAGADGAAGQNNAAADQAARGLIAHWTFDEPNGPVIRDASGNGHHGQVHGAARVEGKLGGALRFDGKDDSASFPRLPPAKALTVSMWVRFESFPHEFCGLVTTDGFPVGAVHYQIVQRSRPALGIRTNREGQVGYLPKHPVFHDGGRPTWIHVAVVYDRKATGVVHYVNGRAIPAQRQPYGQPPVSLAEEAVALTIGPGRIGAWHTDTVAPGTPRDRFFHGAIDDVRIYGRGLSASEISGLVKGPGR
ncbi:MAG: PA14 domain-containing protein [Phycisphaerae bacterium]|nr:PA14 domain-containing protein [Phycisphaerae bacterium]